MTGCGRAHRGSFGGHEPSRQLPLFDTAESVCVASVARTVLRAVRDTVVSVARAVWNWIFF
ncbi:hypothetical protein HCI29_17545 [Escherichia coli]|nr:hypothetical protein [Escherichia coli]HAH9662714.1 hypothetical protein [Escherichia coli]